MSGRAKADETATDSAAEISRLGEVFGQSALAAGALAEGIPLAEFKDALLAELEADYKRRQGLSFPLKFPLSKPCEVFGETYSSLALREPTAADLVKFGVFDEQVNGDQLLDLIAALGGGMTPQTVRQLPGVDMLRLSRKLLAFFGEAGR